MARKTMLCLAVLICSCNGQKGFVAMDGGSDADTDSDTDTDTDSDTDTDADSDTDSDTDTDTDTDSDTDADAGTDSGSDTDTDTDADSDTDSDTDTDTDTDTDSDTDGCETADDCPEGWACGFETHTCFEIPDPDPDDQYIYCWDDDESCSEYSEGMCTYWSPPAWDYADGVPSCDSLPTGCPEVFPTPACCLKNVGEDPCLTESFYP